jgi:hypothetical protein
VGKKKKRGKFDLPKEIFVTQSEEGENCYLSAYDSAEDVAGHDSHPVVAGIYKLVEVGEVSTEVTYKRKRFTKGG